MRSNITHTHANARNISWILAIFGIFGPSSGPRNVWIPFEGIPRPMHVVWACVELLERSRVSYMYNITDTHATNVQYFGHSGAIFCDFWKLVLVVGVPRSYLAGSWG